MRRIETGFRHNAWRITTTPTSWAEGRKEKNTEYNKKAIYDT
jgi:hypothetical protein